MAGEGKLVFLVAPKGRQERKRPKRLACEPKLWFEWRRCMSQRSTAPRRLIVNADDFGRSESINLAVVHAHRQGILTTASLMVNEPAADQAVQLARENPKLGVGLHLALVCGAAALPSERIPHLTGANGQFLDNPVAAGWRYFFNAACKAELRAEIEAQVAKFHATGLPLDHLNGHLHLHLHPVVFGILMDNADRWGIRAMRLTRDPFFLNARLASGQWAYRLSHAVIYRLLSARARRTLARKNIRHTAAVFGLLQNSRVDVAYVEKLLPQLPPGDSELYSHPSLDQFKNEFDALINPDIRNLPERLGIRLIRYQDL
jgi:hopanoid biosynthesis associated protein HpnK